MTDGSVEPCLTFYIIFFLQFTPPISLILAGPAAVRCVIVVHNSTTLSRPYTLGMQSKSAKSNPVEPHLRTVPASSAFPEHWWLPPAEPRKSDSHPSSLRCSNGGSDSNGGQSQSDEGRTEDDEDTAKGCLNAASPRPGKVSTVYPNVLAIGKW